MYKHFDELFTFKHLCTRADTSKHIYVFVYVCMYVYHVFYLFIYLAVHITNTYNKDVNSRSNVITTYKI